MVPIGQNQGAGSRPKLLTSNFLSKFDLNPQFWEITFIEPPIYQKADFSEYQTDRTAVHIF